MLSADDAAVVERDPALPGLGLLLDAEAFAEALGPPLHVEKIESTFYLRYKPQTSCLVGYRVRAEGSERLLVARAHRPDAAEKLEETVKHSRRWASSRPWLLKDKSIVAAFFPYDRRLRQLHRLADESRRRELWKRLFSNRPEWWNAELELLRYKPERRFVGRLVSSGKAVSVVKFYGPRDYEGVYAGTKRLMSGATLRIPRRMARSNSCHAAVFEWLAGCPLDERIARGDLSPADMQRVGVALGELHMQCNMRASLLTSAGQSQAVLAAAAGLDDLCPGSANRAQALARQIVERIREMPQHQTAVHGDLHPGQVLLQEDGVALIDLDATGRGDPAADLGNFLAHLHLAVLHGTVAEHQEVQLGEALLRGYGNQSVSDRVAPWTAAGLLRLGPHPFRRREPNWKHQIDRVLDHADDILAARRALPAGAPGERARPHSPDGSPIVEDRFDAAADPHMPFVRDALDPTDVRRRLAPLAIGISGAEHPIRLRAIRVTRYKPHRRCMIAYDLAAVGGSVTLLGKVRAKRTDRTTCRLIEVLRQAGFGEDATDGIHLPRPVGIVSAWQAWLQEKAPGAPATSLFAGPQRLQLARRIAEAIHKLHRAEAPSRRCHSADDEMRILNERLNEVARIRPAWSRRLERIAQACGRLAASLPASRICGIHRDFYPDQVLVNEEQIYLLDLDLYCRGDPALDLGNFCAHLVEQALRTLGHPAALSDAEGSLVDRYLELSGRPVRRAIEAYTTLSLARHIFISTRFPDRAPRTARLMELCEDRLALPSA
jgi:Ser/Thr protein kinase RdoA (MazF antagonist)